jgi:putative transposase
MVSVYRQHVAPARTHLDLQRGRSSVYTLQVHLVFVTKYRRPVFTDAMLTYCEHLVSTICGDLRAELREFNGETDHVHLLVPLPAQSGGIGTSQSPQGRLVSPARPAIPRSNPEVPVGPHFWSPSYFAASCGGAPLSIIKQYIEQQNRPD